MTERVTQLAALLAWLQAGDEITPLEALSAFGCFRLGGRIYDLKKQGYDIRKHMVTTPSGARVASYSLVRDDQQIPMRLVS